MHLDASIRLFIDHPARFQLKAVEDHLIALPRIENPESKAQAISQATLVHLTLLAKSDPLAKLTLERLRQLEVKEIKSGWLSVFGALRGASNKDLPILEGLLAAWCELKIEEAEYEKRIEAAHRIRLCFIRKNSHLNLEGLGLSSLPECIGLLKHVTDLDLGRNRLSTLPVNIKNLTVLWRLDVSGNVLAQWPVGLCQLSRLEQLYLQDNQLTSLPSSFASLVNLQQLSLKGNRLDHLPEGVLQLINLSYLNLAHNAIEQIPPSIARLAYLESLNLQGNGIRELPEAFCRLRQLEALNIRQNLMTQLPAGWGRLEQLSIFYYEDNPWQVSPATVWGRARDISSSILDHSLLGLLEFWDRQHQSLQSGLDKDVASMGTYLQRNWRSQQHASSLTSISRQTLHQKYRPLIDHPSAQLLSEFLRRLNTLADFSCRIKRPQLVAKVQAMLTLAAKKAAFREPFFSEIREGLGACDDRIMVSFYALCTLHALYDASDLTKQRLASIVLGHKRKALLDLFASDYAKKAARSDELEIGLYLLLRTKDELKIPTDVNQMIFENVGKVKISVIEEAKAFVMSHSSSVESIVDILVDDKFWSEWIRKESQKAFDDLRDDFSARIDTCMEDDSLSQQQALEKINALSAERQKAALALLKQETARWLAESRPLI